VNAAEASESSRAHSVLNIVYARTPLASPTWRLNAHAGRKGEHCTRQAEMQLSRQLRNLLPFSRFTWHGSPRADTCRTTTTLLDHPISTCQLCSRPSTASKTAQPVPGVSHQPSHEPPNTHVSFSRLRNLQPRSYITTTHQLRESKYTAYPADHMLCM
jgi:hypothetical protein